MSRRRFPSHPRAALSTAARAGGAALPRLFCCGGEAPIPYPRIARELADGAPLGYLGRSRWRGSSATAAAAAAAQCGQSADLGHSSEPFYATTLFDDALVTAAVSLCSLVSTSHEHPGEQVLRFGQPSTYMYYPTICDNQRVSADTAAAYAKNQCPAAAASCGIKKRRCTLV